jgi:hypothetical protein
MPDLPLAQATLEVLAAATAVVGAGAIERTSIGADAIMSNPYPSSGWWQCQDPDALDGRRWFAEGSWLQQQPSLFRPRTSAGRRTRRR